MKTAVYTSDPLVHKIARGFVDNELSVRVARRFIASYFNIGDIVLYGRWKNHHGRIIGFGKDKWGNPTVTIEPVPLGRKKPKTFGLFKLWKADVKEQAMSEALQESELSSPDLK